MGQRRQGQNTKVPSLTKEHYARDKRSSMKSLPQVGINDLGERCQDTRHQRLLCSSRLAKSQT
jgi:hypothetical protein